MRFETIPSGETRQLDGPWFGVRVLAAGDGASVAVDRLVLPMSVLPTLQRPMDVIVASGPIVLALADAEGENVNAASASPIPPVPAGPSSVTTSIITIPVGTDIETGVGVQVPHYFFARPPQASSLRLWMDSLSTTPISAWIAEATATAAIVGLLGTGKVADSVAPFTAGAAVWPHRKALAMLGTGTVNNQVGNGAQGYYDTAPCRLAGVMVFISGPAVAAFVTGGPVVLTAVWGS